MKKPLSLLLIVLLLTSSLQIASAGAYHEGVVVKFYGDMCGLTTAKAWGEDEFNRTYFSAAAFLDLINSIGDENEFHMFGEAAIYAVEHDLLGFAYNESEKALKALFSGADTVLMVNYLLASNELQYEYIGFGRDPDMALVRAQMLVEGEGYKFYQLSSSLLNGCLGVLNDMFPAGSSASTAAEDISVPSVSPVDEEDTSAPSVSTATAEGTSVTVTSDYLSLRNANGSTITSIAKGTSFIITGYDASVGMFTAEYDGTTGYVKGTGLNIAQNELLNLFQ